MNLNRYIEEVLIIALIVFILLSLALACIDINYIHALNPVWAGETLPGPVKLKPQYLDDRINLNHVLKGEDNIVISSRKYWKCYVSGGDILNKDRIFLCTKPKYISYKSKDTIKGLKDSDLIIYKQNGIYYIREVVSIISRGRDICCKTLISTGNNEWIKSYQVKYVVRFEVYYEKESVND